MPHEIDEWYVCDVTGARTRPVDNDLDDDEEDPRLAAGWTRVTLERVDPNPEYAEALANVVKKRAAMEKAMEAARAQGASDDEVQQVRDLLESQIEEVDEPAHIVVRKVAFTAPGEEAAVLAALGGLVFTEPAAVPSPVAEV